MEPLFRPVATVLGISGSLEPWSSLFDQQGACRLSVSHTEHAGLPRSLLDNKVACLGADKVI